MMKDLTFAQYLLAAGVGLGLVGLVLWWRLPIPTKIPPFALTSVLAISYGSFELWRNRAGSDS